MKNKTLIPSAHPASNPSTFPVTVSKRYAVADRANTLANTDGTDSTTPDTAVSVTPADQLTTGRAPRTLGYIRVSSRDQNEARQLDAMNEFGVDKIYTDKQSGKDFNRPAYFQLMADLHPGDILVVKSIDRLGRNYDEILEQWRVITKEKQAAIVVLDMPLLDTRNSRDLTGTLIADIVLQLLSYVAETERQFIKQRQKEGIAAAKARGQRFGRPCFVRTEEYQTIRKLWQDGQISANKAARILNIHHTTFLKWARMDGECVDTSTDGDVIVDATDATGTNSTAAVTTATVDATDTTDD